MAELLLLRHAKSSWDSGVEGDHERPLAPRGVRAARTMGRVLAGWGWLPDVVLTSSAVRARDTVELARQAGQWPCPVEVVDWLYGAEPAGVVSRLAGRDELPPRVLIAGHEPTLSELVSLLISGGRVRMPTAAVACLELEGEWRELAPGRGRLLWLITPKLVQSSVP